MRMKRSTLRSMRKSSGTCSPGSWGSMSKVRVTEIQGNPMVSETRQNPAMPSGATGVEDGGTCPGNVAKKGGGVLLAEKLTTCVQTVLVSEGRSHPAEAEARRGIWTDKGHHRWGGQVPDLSYGDSLLIDPVGAVHDAATRSQVGAIRFQGNDSRRHWSQHRFTAELAGSEPGTTNQQLRERTIPQLKLCLSCAEAVQIYLVAFV